MKKIVSMRRLRLSVLATAALVLGCQTQKSAVRPNTGHSPAATSPRTAAPVADLGPQPGCAASISGGPPVPIQIGTRMAERMGTTLRINGPDSDGKTVLGILGPINEDSGANVVALKRDLDFFEKNHADAIVVTGDLGEVESGIQHVVEVLAQSGLPILAVIGNRECGGDFQHALEAASRELSNVVNLDEIRRVELPGATLVSLPGYGDPNFIDCDTGCQYTSKTLADVVTLAQSAPSPVVLVSHGPPLGQGSQAIDWAYNGGNVGDARINQVIERAHIHFGVFSNIKEAGSRATDLAGTTVIPPGRLVHQLYLNPGPAGADPWKMNDGTVGHGFAALLVLEDGEASWQRFAGAQLTPAEQKQAQAIDQKNDAE